MNNRFFKMLHTMVLAGALAAIAAPAAAENKAVSLLPATGADLVTSLKICREAEVDGRDVANFRACFGFLAGIIIGSTATASEAGIPPLFCLPEGTGDIAVQDNIVQYIEKDPRVATQTAHVAILDALNSLYPCK